jgi:hypothetical protein
MKTIIKIFILWGIIMFTAFSCKDKDNENPVIPIQEDRLLEVKNLTWNGCKSGNYYNANEYIEIQSIDSNYLEIKHINALFNCVPVIIIEAEIEKGVIIYSEEETGGMANCLCLFDVSCNIGPLDYYQYTFAYNREGERIAEFDFYFSSSTHEIFEID